MKRDIEEIWSKVLCRVDAANVFLNLLTAMQPKPVHSTWSGSQVLLP